MPELRRETIIKVVEQRDLSEDEITRTAVLLKGAPLFFTPVEDFVGRHGDNKSSYVKGMRYTLRTGNTVLARCLAIWEAGGYVSIGGGEGSSSEPNKVQASDAVITGEVSVK